MRSPTKTSYRRPFHSLAYALYVGMLIGAIATVIFVTLCGIGARP